MTLRFTTKDETRPSQSFISDKIGKNKRKQDRFITICRYNRVNQPNRVALEYRLLSNTLLRAGLSTKIQRIS
jgi:hypothetical protein